MAGEATAQMVSNIGIHLFPSKDGTTQTVVNVGVENPELLDRTTPSQGWGVPLDGPQEYVLLKDSSKAVAYMTTDVTLGPAVQEPVVVGGQPVVSGGDNVTTGATPS